MMPQDLNFFETDHAKDWLELDRDDFESLAGVNALSPSEKVHLAGVAPQQQWICDVADTPEARKALATFGFRLVDASDGFLVASGSTVVAQYAEFRLHRLSLVEVGVLYGYAPSAVIAHAGIIAGDPVQAWPTTAAEYFLGGRFSLRFVARERARIARQWQELIELAPSIAALAERSFAFAQPANRAEALSPANITNLDCSFNQPLLDSLGRDANSSPNPLKGPASAV